MKLRRSRTFFLLRVLLYLCFLVLAYLVLHRIAVVIAPVGTGLFLAYLLNPAVRRLECRGVPRPVAIALLLLGFCAGLAAVIILVPPLLSSEFASFGERWGGYQERLQTVLLPWLRKTLHLSRAASAEETMRQLLSRIESAWENASGSITGTLSGAFRTATGILRLLIAFLLTPVFAIYFLNDFPRLHAGASELVPPRHRASVFALLREINHALASWVRGQLTVMMVLGALYATGLALTGLPLGIAIGLLTGVMAFVPYVGVLIGFCIALLVALLDPHPASAIAGVLATFAAVQTLDALFVTPRVLGGRVGLSPVTVIFALTLGGELLGYAGVILAVPTAAVCKVLLAHARKAYAGSAFYTGAPAAAPLASDEASALPGPPAAGAAASVRSAEGS